MWYWKKMYLCDLKFCNHKKIKIMATATLEYDVRNIQSGQMIIVNRCFGLATRKKSGLEEALDDVANGRLTTIHIPKNRKKQ